MRIKTAKKVQYLHIIHFYKKKITACGQKDVQLKYFDIRFFIKIY